MYVAHDTEFKLVLQDYPSAGGHLSLHIHSRWQYHLLLPPPCQSFPYICRWSECDSWQRKDMKKQQLIFLYCTMRNVFWFAILLIAMLYSTTDNPHYPLHNACCTCYIIKMSTVIFLMFFYFWMYRMLCQTGQTKAASTLQYSLKHPWPQISVCSLGPMLPCPHLRGTR